MSKIVEKQIEAYNKKDLEEFLACYAEETQAFMLESNQQLTNGKEQLRQIMSKSFLDAPESNSSVLNSLTQGNLVINKEKITGHTKNDMIITTLSIYEVINNQITKVWFGGRQVEK